MIMCKMTACAGLELPTTVRSCLTVSHPGYIIVISGTQSLGWTTVWICFGQSLSQMWKSISPACLWTVSLSLFLFLNQKGKEENTNARNLNHSDLLEKTKVYFAPWLGEYR
jgi:hypothetical protein